MRDENVLKAKLYHIFVVLIFPSKLKGVLILKQILIDESCSMRNVESWAVRSWYRTQYKRGRIDRIVFPNNQEIWQRQQGSSKPSEVCSPLRI